MLQIKRDYTRVDYLDRIEQERATAQSPTLSSPPPAPVALQYAAPSGPSPVRSVGLAQRRIMWVILAAVLFTFSLFGGAFILPADPQLQGVVIGTLAIGRLAILILMMASVYQLSAALGSNMFTRIVSVLAMLLPLINLIVLLLLNQRATQMLQRHGVKVGLMGARLSDLPAV